MEEQIRNSINQLSFVDKALVIDKFNYNLSNNGVSKHEYPSRYISSLENGDLDKVVEETKECMVQSYVPTECRERLIKASKIYLNDDVELHDHQIQALYFMEYRERNIGYRSDILTSVDQSGHISERNCHKDMYGGLIQYQMGMGKTLIALIHAFISPKIGGEPSLVVVPKTLLMTWKNDLVNMFKPEYHNQLLLFHKDFCGGRELDSFKVENYTVVVVTFDYVANTFMDKEFHTEYEQNDLDEIRTANTKKSFRAKERTISNATPIHLRIRKETDYNLLFQVTWTRVILDESQIISNCATRKYHGCTYLKKQFGWCLTGTAIPNTGDDILSQMKFIGYQCDKALSLATYTLSNLNRYVLVKNMYLPPYTNNLIDCQLSDEEKRIYALCSVMFLDNLNVMRYAKYKSGVILAIFTRLRQLSSAPYLLDKYADREGLMGVKSTKVKRIVEIVQKAKKDNEKVLVFSSFNGLIDIARFAVDTCNDCKECEEKRKQYEIDEIERSKKIFLQKSKYVSDRKEKQRIELESKEGDLTDNEKVQLAELTDYQLKGIETVEMKQNYKFDFNVFGDLHDETERQLIKVGWEKTLPIVCNYKRCDECVKNRILSSELSGKMADPILRDQMLTNFKNDPNQTVLFSQYKTGSVGLNIQCANNVILVDPHWNNAMHKQSIARCWRFGQTKHVVVNRLFIADTVDAFILDKCKKKEMLSRQILERNGSINDATIEGITFQNLIDILNDMRKKFDIPLIGEKQKRVKNEKIK
jgi:SNF2 family DNA or RNA helicase